MGILINPSENIYSNFRRIYPVICYLFRAQALFYVNVYVSFCRKDNPKGYEHN